jgi:adenylate cyclase class 2
MYEVELKVRAEHENVTTRLEELGATRVEQIRQVDTYYNAPDRDFAQTDEALRIRRQSDGDEERTLLTYKGPLVDSESKTRQEAETEFEDDDAMQSILDGLGYEAAATVSKDRVRYSMGEWTITLDTVDGLGEFVEVELETDVDLEAEGTGRAVGGETEESLETLRDEAANVMEDVGLDPDEQIRTSYLGLLLDADEGV